MLDIPCQPSCSNKPPGPVPHTEAEWVQHKPLLQQLYFTNKKTAKEVQEYMRETFQFHASLQQYQRQFKKWGMEKNKPEERWTRLPGLLKCKRLDVDHAEVWDGGVVQDRKRVKKYLSRNNPLTLEHKHRLGVDPTEESAMAPCTGDDFFVRVALTPRLVLSTPTNLPWFDCIRSLDLGPLEGSLARHLPSSPVSQGRIMNEELLENVSASQGNLLGGSLLDTQQHTTALSIHGSESLEHLTTSLVDMICPNRRLKQRPDLEMQFHLQLEASMPAEVPGDIDIDRTSLIQIPTVHSFSVGVAYLFYVITNNLWDGGKTESALASVFEIPGMVQFIVTSSKPSAKPLTQCLVKYAIDTEDLELLKALRTHGIDFDNPIQSIFAVTPVQYVISRDWEPAEEMLEFLLECGADPNKCLEHGKALKPGQNACCQYCPIMRAMLCSSPGPVVDILLAAGCHIPRDVDITLAISEGFGTDTLKTLLSEASLEPERPLIPFDHLYPLQAAVAKSNEEIVEVLLQHGAGPSGWTDAELESDFPYIDSVLSEYDIHIDVSHIQPPLTTALLRSAKRITQILLDAGANVNHFHASGLEDCLDPNLVLENIKKKAAVYMENLPDVETILHQWVPVHSCHGTPPLVLAALSGNLALVQLLIRYGVDVSETEDDNLLHTSKRRRFSALGAAAAIGDIRMMNLLIQAGADINQPAYGPGVLSPLQAAVYFRQHQSIQFLCQNGADASLPGAEEDGLTAIEAAIYAEDYWSFEFLCCRCRPNTNSVTLAVGLRDGLFFQKLVEMGYNIHDPEIFTKSLTAGHFHRLIRAGVRLEMPSQGKTLADLAFTVAAETRDVSVMRLILDNGHILSGDALAAIEPCSWYDMSEWDFKAYIDVLMTAITSSKTPARFPAIALVLVGSLMSSTSVPWLHNVVHAAVEFLIAHGMDVDARYTGGTVNESRTPIQIAAASSLIDIGRLLVENGAEVNKRPHKTLRTAFQETCLAKELKMISLLLDRGADVNAAPPQVPTGRAGFFLPETALQLACAEGNVDIVILLIKHGANVDAAASCDEMGRTALQAACEGGHVEIVNLLINRHADVNAPAGPNRGVTALQAAAIKGFLRIVQILIAAGADVAAPASPVEGRTAIDGVAERGRLDIVQYLLDQYEGNESISAVCDRARGYAWREGHMGVVQLLDEYQRHPA